MEYDNGGGINAVALHPNQGELIAGDQNGNIRVFDLTQNKMSHEQQSNVGSPVRSISIAADASLAATAHDNGVCVLWKLPTDSQTVSHFEERRIFQAHDTYVRRPRLCAGRARLCASDLTPAPGLSGVEVQAEPRSGLPSNLLGGRDRRRERRVDAAGQS